MVEICAKCQKERGNGIFVCKSCYDLLKEITMKEVRAENTIKLNKLKEEFIEKLNRLIQLS